MYSTSYITKFINGRLYGDNKLEIEGVCSIKEGKERHITFLSSKNSLNLVNDTCASVIIIGNDI